ncbi:hypothetical protein PS910_00055 [Pseudomonas fluorescens]|nr:hypothetical protein PS910_00055 [Pseudomonas fluorescens]
MSDKSVVHSNAFNFLSFMQNSVDPRTGQYALGITLPALPSNDLAGPELPLRLVYNPLNTEDTGYGRGWNFSLSQFVPMTGALSLHTGESFKVTGIDDQPAAIAEKKLDSFHFHKDDEDNYRLVHKSGLVEWLQTRVSDGVKVALPYRVYSASGHWIELTYQTVRGHACLSSISDATSLRLLAIDYIGTSSYRIHLHPDSATVDVPDCTYDVRLTDLNVTTVELPGEDKASWRFTYENSADTQNMTVLKTVATPTGSVETLDYDAAGHVLPSGAPRATLPRVKTHRIDPGCNQPVVITEYAYSMENFLGGNSGIVWSDGVDNLYKTGSAYRFHCITTLKQGSEALRKTRYEFNRHHLMTSQRTEQKGPVITYPATAEPEFKWFVKETNTRYHELPEVGFDAQPAYFQLPHEVTDVWKMADGSGDSRSEVTLTLWDEHGNPTLEQRPDGTRLLSEYYPKEQSEGCPADPHGFVRNLKSQTVEPSSDFESTPQAQTLRTDYRYGKLDSVLPPSAGLLRTRIGAYWLQVTREQLSDVDGTQDSLLRDIATEYFDVANDRFLHGRSQSTRRTQGELQTTTTFAYERIEEDGHPLLQTIQTIIGFDHGEPEDDQGSTRDSTKQITLLQSTLIDEPWLNRDDNDVEIAYRYDALRRVVSETVAPNDAAYRAARTYTYQLVSAPGQQALQTEVNVKQVATQARLDGFNRVVEISRHDADALDIQRHQTYRTHYTADYDVFGNMVKEVDMDWLDRPDPENPEGAPIVEVKELPRHFRFDGWNQQYCQIEPDGVMRVEHTDLIGTQQSANRPIRTHWSQTPDGIHKSGRTVTWLNAFDKPIREQRLDTAGSQVSLHRYYYDGLGRTVREVDGRQASVAFTYDAFDRLVTHTLADNSVVRREYAPHSSEDLPTSIKVGDKLLGEQRFDGLDRMIASITGGRKRTLHYAPGQRQPQWVITPRNLRIDYEYVPQLGEEPLRRAIPEGVVDYDYDKRDARLLSCTVNETAVLQRDYFSTGQLKTETRREENSASPYTMHYGYSLKARQLFYTDVLGQTQTYHYDEAGRLSKTRMGNTQAVFEYDELGRMKSYVTTDGGQRLGTYLTYDDFDREIERRFEMQDDVQVLEQTYDAVDAVTSRHLMAGEETLRHEAYEYDPRGRLTSYQCSGPLAPVDPQDKIIRQQIFTFDELDNITLVRTDFPGADGTRDERNYATYLFENEKDPAQLTGITHTHADYGDPITLIYDEDGNLIKDEQARRLDYDALGRLSAVVESSGNEATYGYDPLDRLASQAIAES